MARTLRLPLLTVLAVLAFLYFSEPTTVAAAPVCSNQSGHFFDCDPIMGTADSSCTSSGHGEYCQIGTICWDWDCVRNPDGTYSVQNVVNHSPTFCYCDAIHFHCC